ncbi:MAG: HAD family hydrolase [Tractidigestivibacter sp.]|jgi:FMN phosphatase YigB (HAD superfamily)|uniref:HAD family hydrolase n=1 Tax=Tractidigestivibacter sp. TaxID=2847320 RepID=UPI003D8A5B6B
MIKAVLFDLDDTLLDVNFTPFMVRYIAGFSSLIAKAARMPTVSLGIPISLSYLAMENEKRADDLTNHELFVQVMKKKTGIPLDDPAFIDLLEYYDSQILPDLNGRIVDAHQQRGTKLAVETVHNMGLTCALATNPAFSLSCVKTRIGWAGLSPSDFVLISHWDNSHRLKPSARFYQEFVNKLGYTCDECLMVGNDASRDFPRPDCGLRTAYVGRANPKRAVWRGSMYRFADELPQIIDRLSRVDIQKK